MNTKMKTLAAAGLLMAPSTATANEGTFGFGYLHLDDGDVGLGAFTATIGFVVPVNDVFSIIPELRVGAGINDDSFDGIDIELKSLAGGNLRFEFDLSDAAYMFISPSYTRYKVKGSVPAAGGTFSVSETDDSFGLGGGFGFYASEGFSIEAGYERIDGINVVTLGGRRKF
jgi:hypothetical protein